MSRHKLWHGHKYLRISFKNKRAKIPHNKEINMLDVRQADKKRSRCKHSSVITATYWIVYKLQRQLLAMSYFISCGDVPWASNHGNTRSLWFTQGIIITTIIIIIIILCHMIDSCTRHWHTVHKYNLCLSSQEVNSVIRSELKHWEDSRGLQLRMNERHSDHNNGC